ncbi:DUF4148 domain-containing protein [Caballeronia sordidicola]|nr:DUF4148 domain-containing protein [Caballeronia sordidicola]
MVVHRRPYKLLSKPPHRRSLIERNQIMKASKNIPAVLVLTCASVVAFAQTPPSGKTRQQVQQELVQARHDGIIPTTKNDYPPSAATVARNQDVHAVTKHPGERVPAQADLHDTAK